MNPIPKTNKLAKSLAGVVAMIATVTLLGSPLILAEYYAETSAADHAVRQLTKSESLHGSASS